MPSRAATTAGDTPMQTGAEKIAGDTFIRTQVHYYSTVSQPQTFCCVAVCCRSVSANCGLLPVAVKIVGDIDET